MRRLVLSFGAATLLLAGFLFALDPAVLAGDLADADLGIFALGLVSILAALVCWAEASRRLFVAFAPSLTRRRALVAYGAGAFGKQVLPMGNAGGPAVMAYAFDRELDLGYGRSLGVIVVAEFLSLVASLLLGFVGVAGLLLYSSSEADLLWPGVGVALAGGALLAASLLVWYRRRHVELAVVGVSGLLAPIVTRISPSRAAGLQPTRVTATLRRYYETFDTVLGNRRVVVYAFALSQLGWVFFALPLYAAGLALGVRVPLALALFLVPAAGLATVVPLPGGLGGVEASVAGLLVVLAGVDLTSAGAVVILYRACSYLFFVLVCGLATTMAAVDVGELSATPEAPPTNPPADTQ